MPPAPIFLVFWVLWMREHTFILAPKPQLFPQACYCILSKWKKGEKFCNQESFKNGLLTTYSLIVEIKAGSHLLNKTLGEEEELFTKRSFFFFQVLIDQHLLVGEPFKMPPYAWEQTYLSTSSLVPVSPFCTGTADCTIQYEWPYFSLCHEKGGQEGV